MVASYSPSLAEIVLSVGGYGVAGLLITIGIWAFPMLPGSFANDEHPAAAE